MTVHDLFRNCDPNKVCNIFVDQYIRPDDFYKMKLMKQYKESHDTKDMTIENFEELAIDHKKEHIKKTIAQICEMEPNAHPDTICSVIKCYDYVDKIEESYDVACFYKGIDLSSVEGLSEVTSKADLKNRRVPELFCFMYDDRKDILGFEMCQASLHLYDMNEVAAAVFHEITWFGYDYDIATRKQKAEAQKLTEIAEDIHGQSFNTYEELCRSLGIEPEGYVPTEYDEQIMEEEAVKNYNETLRFWNAYKVYDID